MKKLQLLSDIHLERHRDEGQAFVESLDPTGIDIMVLAGDITNDWQLPEVLSWFCDHYPQVVFVAGNHEYYHSNVLKVTKVLSQFQATHDNFTWLNCKLAVVDGVRFVGGTLWFPKPTDAVLALRRQINDFHLIGEIEPWVYEEHERCVGVLQALAHTADVVVTHHVPAAACTAVRFGGALNHFFVHDMTDLIEKAQPPLWLFGHTHDQWDTHIGKTRLVATPLGYPHEQGDPDRGVYKERVVIEVKPR